MSSFSFSLQKKEMEKPEYIAVPTSEELPDYQEQRRKPRFRYCAFFIKGAFLVVALLAISVLHKTYLTKNQSVVSSKIEF